MIAEGSLRKVQGNRFVDSHEMNAPLPARGMGGYVKPVHCLWEVKSDLFLRAFLHHDNRFPKNFSFSLKPEKKDIKNQWLPKIMCFPGHGRFALLLLDLIHESVHLTFVISP